MVPFLDISNSNIEIQDFQTHTNFVKKRKKQITILGIHTSTTYTCSIKLLNHFQPLLLFYSAVLDLCKCLIKNNSF